jgi:galactokinase
MYDEQLVKKTMVIHAQNYGSEPATVAYAPGRIEVLGNHTDYNEGTVLSAAINMGHCFCISESNQPGVRLTAGDLGESTTFNPADGAPLDKEVQWANYVKGVMYFLREYGVEIDGIDCTFLGSIPMGAGLSSSAALEVATAYAVLAHTGKTIDQTDIARIGQRAEHDFAGCSCGLLDQFSSIHGVHHGLIHSDFRTLETFPVKLPDDIVFLMINPHVKHALAESPYNARRKSCEKAAAQLNELLDHEVRALRDVSAEEFEAHKNNIAPEAALRATHIVHEITRVEKGVKLLHEGNIESFGQFMYDSHETSRNHFENSCEELDTVVEAARDAGALGARLSGGGWGGSVVALVHAADADAICKRIIETCRTKGLEPTAETIIPSSGATIIKQPSGVYS